MLQYFSIGKNANDKDWRKKIQAKIEQQSSSAYIFFYEIVNLFHSEIILERNINQNKLY